jgi:hypothetical protein
VTTRNPARSAPSKWGAAGRVFFARFCDARCRLPGGAAVAVRVHTAGEVEEVSLLRDNILDLATDIDVEPSWNNRFRVELTRLDTGQCPVSVVWSEAGTR